MPKERIIWHELSIFKCLNGYLRGIFLPVPSGGWREESVLRLMPRVNCAKGHAPGSSEAYTEAHTRLMPEKALKHQVFPDKFEKIPVFPSEI